MTQALALAAFLREAGHEVVKVLIGRSPHRPVPEYFTDGIDAPISSFQAPAQVAGMDRQGLSVVNTLADAVWRSPRFVRAIRKISEGTSDADVVINLMDFMGGLSRTLSSSDGRVPWVAIAHNYLFFHPELRDLPGPELVRRGVIAYTRATTAGTQRRLALAFTPMSEVPELGLEVTPPLLRPGLGTLRISDEGFLLAYALNSGYGERLADWQRRNPEVEVHCFVEGGSSTFATAPGPGFHAHELHDRSFLEHLAACRAYVGSAGFESICEAHYLGKPVLAVPTEGQFEQTLNAWDAARCGAARWGGYEDLDSFWASPEAPSDEVVRRFRDWVGLAPERSVEAVERVAGFVRPAAATMHRAD